MVILSVSQSVSHLLILETLQSDVTFETFDQSDEGTWPDQQKDNGKDKDKYKDNDKDKYI